MKGGFRKKGVEIFSRGAGLLRIVGMGDRKREGKSERDQGGMLAHSNTITGKKEHKGVCTIRGGKIIPFFGAKKENFGGGGWGGL